jgi:hypothetical protein
MHLERQYNCLELIPDRSRNQFHVIHS